MNSPRQPKSAEILQPTQKPDLILVHGFRGSPLGLATIAEELRQSGYTVHTPALPPFAGAKFASEQDENPYSPDTYARYLRDYIKSHQLIRPILIGHSMGSIVVAATAQRHSELIHQKLILLSPISNRTPRIISVISPLANFLPRQIVDYATTKYLFVPHDPDLFRQTLKLTNQCSADQPPQRSELTSAMRFSTRYAVTDFLNHDQKDLIIIAGSQDRLISQKTTRKLAEKYHATLELISDSGHLHNYEKPHETAQLILKHLEI